MGILDGLARYSRQRKGKYQYWLGFEYGTKTVWAHPTGEEFEVNMMRECLHEYLTAPQQVQ